MPVGGGVEKSWILFQRFNSARNSSLARNTRSFDRQYDLPSLAEAVISFA